jgi:uncharacterized membrane protein (UPF0127 family)
MKMTFRIIILVLTFLSLGILPVFSPSSMAAQQSDVQAKNIAVSTATTEFSIAPTAHIMIAGVVLTVDLAETAAAQQNGLSGRPSLPSDHGMLFVFGHEDYWAFWMIDMKFPLDIIWFNSTRQLVFLEPNLPPCTPQNCPVVTPIAKAMYVLEVNAGFVAAHHIARGTPFVFLDH